MVRAFGYDDPFLSMSPVRLQEVVVVIFIYADIHKWYGIINMIWWCIVTQLKNRIAPNFDGLSRFHIFHPPFYALKVWTLQSIHSNGPDTAIKHGSGLSSIYMAAFMINNDTCRLRFFPLPRVISGWQIVSRFQVSRNLVQTSWGLILTPDSPRISCEFQYFHFRKAQWYNDLHPQKACSWHQLKIIEYIYMSSKASTQCISDPFRAPVASIRISGVWGWDYHLAGPIGGRPHASRWTKNASKSDSGGTPR